MATGAFLVAVVLALVGSAAGAAPTQGGDAPPPGQPTLVSQTATVPADGVFVVRVGLGELDGDSAGVAKVPVAVAGLDVAVVVHGKLADAAALADEPPEPINRLPVRAVSELGVDADGVMTVRVPIRPGPPFDGVERVLIPEPGVYPVTIELRDDEGVRSSLQTTLIRLPDSSAEQASGDDEPSADDGTGPSASLVLALTGLGPDPDGTNTDDAAGADNGTNTDNGAGAEGGAVVAPSAELLDAAELLAGHADVPITVVLGPDHLGELQRDPALAATFRAAVGGRPVVPIPGPTLDPSSLAAIDQGPLYGSSLEGARSMVATLGLTPAPATAAISGPQTIGGARLLIEAGATVAVDLSSPTTTNDPSSSGPLTTAAGVLTVITADEHPAPAGAVTAGGTPAEHDQRLLARLFLADGSRPIVVSAGGAGPDRIATLGLLLDVVDAAPIDVVPLAAAAAMLTELDPVAPATRPVDDLAPVAGGVLEAQDLLATYDTFYVDGGRTPDAYRQDITASLAVGHDVERRQRTISELIGTLQSELSVISLPGNQSVTLAARSVPIPLTIENRSSGPRQVLLQFRSDKIVVAEQGQLITIEPGTSSIDVQVEARSLGVSPLQVSVLSPDGRHTLSTTRFQVRSTAVPGLGLLISAIGLGLLVLWWSLSIRRRRSAHPSRPAPPPPSRPPLEDGGVDRDRTLAGDSV